MALPWCNDDAQPVRVLPVDAWSDHAQVTLLALRVVKDRSGLPEVFTAAGCAVRRPWTEGRIGQREV